MIDTALTSIKQSPGVTTLAVALSYVWPGVTRPVVAEVDPAGSDLVGWYQAYGVAVVPGLSTMLHRGSPFAENLQEIDGGPTILAGTRTIIESVRASATWDKAIAAMQAYSGVIIADCGRTAGDTLRFSETLRVARRVLVVTKGQIEHINRLKTMQGEIGQWGSNVGVVFVGDSVSSLDAVRESVSIPIVAHIPYSDDAKDLARGNHPSTKARNRSPFWRAVHDLAHELASPNADSTESEVAQ